MAESTVMGRLARFSQQKRQRITTASENLGIVNFAKLQFLKRLVGGQELTFTSKRLRYPVVARNGTSDISVFYQIFIDREYSCLDGIKAPDLIIDLGANVGYSSAYFLSRYPDCTILAVEPDPDNFALLQRNVAPYGNRCRTLQAAIWGHPGQLQFKAPLKRGAEWGRALEVADDCAAVQSGEDPVEGITMAKLLEMSPFPRVSILKIDIEGAELELFGHDTAWLDRVDHMVIELHGDQARDCFFRAIEGRNFDISSSGELTCCIDKTRS